jgi:hypothetical protein
MLAPQDRSLRIQGMLHGENASSAPRRQRLPDGCSLPRVNDMATGAQRSAGAVPPRDLDSAGLAAAPWCDALSGPLRATLFPTGGELRPMTTAVGPRTMLGLDRRGRLVLRRCGSPPEVLARHPVAWPRPRLGGGWVTWASGGDPVDDPRPPAGIVRARSLSGDRGVAVRAPRHVVRGRCAPNDTPGAWGFADHTRTRLFWVAILQVNPADELCFAGDLRLFARRLP